MNLETFEVRSFGKWILSGEHAVMRGGTALVFPLYENYIDVRGTLFPENENSTLKLDFKGLNVKGFDLLFWGLLDKAIEKIGRDRSELKGLWTIDSQIPLGAGLGASAALCVAVGKVFLIHHWIEEKDLYEFSRSLEDMFHGESSGVDIAASLANSGSRFVKGQPCVPFSAKWQPNLFVSYSGQRGLTAECVKKVKEQGEQNPHWLEKWDQVMNDATALALTALEGSESEGITKLEKALDMGCTCFYEWGLVEGRLKKHVQELKSAGAIAVKPTGSGGGGYVISLWDGQVPETLRDRLIALKLKQ